MKGYTYQQETARQVGLEAMRNGGGGVGGLAGDAMQLGVGLGTVGSVIGMTREAVAPILQQSMAGNAVSGWNCTCGQTSLTGNFCPNCGRCKPEPQPGGWNCSCGQQNIMGNFCPNCGAKKPTPKPEDWNCSCGQQNITGNFCPNCGKKKED